MQARLRKLAGTAEAIIMMSCSVQCAASQCSADKVELSAVTVSAVTVADQ